MSYTVFQTDEFSQWLNSLRDKVLYHRVVQRIRRMEIGNLGDVKSVGGKVSEARIFANPGVRIYFTVRGLEIVILLCGGFKNTQSADIKRAQQLAKEIGDDDSFD